MRNSFPSRGDVEMKTISLDNAKRLKELWVATESSFFWELNEANKYFKGRVVYGDPSEKNQWSIPFPAYTADELGEMLHLLGAIISVFPQNKGWMCLFAESEREHWETADTMADAMAEMLIWLIGNDHVKVEDL